MSQPRRLNAPLYSPVPSLAAANQSQIDDLVQRNKTLDSMHKKLLDEELLKIRDEHDQAREEWRRSTADLLTLCQIHNRNVQLELETEKGKVTQEMIGVREEKLGRINRDYKLKLWELRSEELEQQVTVLQEGSEDLQHDYEDAESRLRDAQAELKRLTKVSGCPSGGLERLKLQLDGAHTKINDLERSNDELKRSNDQLRRQIDEWQHLERREGEEVDSERKRRVALSVELEKLQAQHKVEVDKLEASLERERQKVQKWKDALDQWQDSAANSEKELQDAENQNKKLQKQVDKLKDDLEIERARVRPPSPSRRANHTHPAEEEEEDIAPPSRKPKASSSKPPSKQRRGKAQASETEGEEGGAKPAKGRKGSEKSKKSKAAEHTDDEGNAERASDGEEVEEVAATTKKRKINKQPGIFPKVDPFNFGGFDFGMGNGLDIPSTLSPSVQTPYHPLRQHASAARRW
ncbi:hypothetical protein FA13DRAFT_1730337 [Coprinellus micaceus]|uniref:Myotonic dystrophy protein kinase coiled coil domain-containing protein n=1 Tax=Coprinellus micaceus TaxID=71717 RepID=A0A4Y7TGQ0_COPMI|nr:hypothetical protein FA13DRAFT_1730337 [Coprinellus micaceus]